MNHYQISPLSSYNTGSCTVFWTWSAYLHIIPVYFIGLVWKSPTAIYFIHILCFTILGISPVLCHLLSCLMCLLYLYQSPDKLLNMMNKGQTTKPMETHSLFFSPAHLHTLCPHTTPHLLSDNPGVFCPTANILTTWPGLRPVLFLPVLNLPGSEQSWYIAGTQKKKKKTKPALQSNC